MAWLMCDIEPTTPAFAAAMAFVRETASPAKALQVSSEEDEL
jgi:hypothetical protein